MSAPIYPDYYPRMEPGMSEHIGRVIQPTTLDCEGEARLDPKYTLMDRLRMAWFAFRLPYGLYNTLHMVQEAKTCIVAADDAKLAEQDPGIDYLEDAMLELTKAELLLKDMIGYQEE